MSAPITGGLAIQLYTLRDFLKTPADIAATLRRVKQIGYDAVEVAGLGRIDAAELAKMLGGEGLVCCGGHVPMEKLKIDLQKVIDDHRKWGCSTIAVPGYWGKTLADFGNFADEFNMIVQTLGHAGMSLGYHNHSHELVKHDGRTPLGLLLEKLSPKAWFEIDTYWLVHGGADPIAWIDKVHGRMPCVHLKDMGIEAGGHQFMAEVGEGNLNWPGILSACRGAGTRWLVVEQDVCRHDPFVSIEMSLKNLRGMGV
jgi:sugar phosphate isomerase/epimerase